MNKNYIEVYFSYDYCHIEAFYFHKEKLFKYESKISEEIIKGINNIFDKDIFDILDGEFKEKDIVYDFNWQEINFKLCRITENI